MSRNREPVCRQRRDGDERGFSLIELMVASTILLIALAAILGGFAQAQQTAASEQTHTVAVDGVRQAVDVFAKDVREATSVTFALSTKLVMTTNVNEVSVTVTWQTATVGGQIALQRQVGSGAFETIVPSLTVGDVFVYEPNDPASVREIMLVLHGAAAKGRQPVDVSTEVTLRNAT